MTLVEVDRPADGVARLTLRREAKRNALSIEVQAGIADGLEALAADDAVKVVIITGAGPVFSAGFDLTELQASLGDPALSEQLWATSDRYHGAVLRCPLVTIAAVNGPALAGGFDLAVLCDLRIAAASARFAHPERTFGDVVYGPLHDLVGGAVARDLVMTGREVGAADALALHLVSEVVPDADLADAALAMAVRVAEAPADALRRTKAKALRRAAVALDGGTLDL